MRDENSDLWHEPEPWQCEGCGAEGLGDCAEDCEVSCFGGEQGDDERRAA